MIQDPVHACLDGDRAPEQLAPQERERLARMQATLSAVAEQLRAEPTPDLVGRVMAGLPAGGPARPVWRRIAAWLWAPRPVSLRPAYGLAGAGFALAALLIASSVTPGEPGAAPVEATAMYVQFRLELPGAREVALAGSFTDWQPRYMLHQVQPGVWTVLVPLQPGVHDYAFVVDGTRWTPDPYAPQVDDQFGGTNNRISLAPPGPAV